MAPRRRATPGITRMAALLTHKHRQAYNAILMRRVAVFIPEDLLSGLKALKAEHGTPEAESIRRAIAAYLAEKGVTPQGRSKTSEKRPKRKS